MEEKPIVMPKMGESIAEATIIRWLKNEGERVEKEHLSDIWRNSRA